MWHIWHHPSYSRPKGAINPALGEHSMINYPKRENISLIEEASQFILSLIPFFVISPTPLCFFANGNKTMQGLRTVAAHLEEAPRYSCYRLLAWMGTFSLSPRKKKKNKSWLIDSAIKPSGQYKAATPITASAARPAGSFLPRHEGKLICHWVYYFHKHALSDSPHHAP